MSDLLSIYHRLPYPLRSLAASLHGFRLQSIRYSAETGNLVAEAHERERWSAVQWDVWQSERLDYTLDFAAKHVPYYRQQWQARRRAGDRASWEMLENWPVLKKDVIRDTPGAFVADNVQKKDRIVEHTSGTTGKPMTFWLSRDAVQNWYALFEARWRGWYGISRHDRWGILGGQLVVPFRQSRPPFWVWNAGMKQLYLSSYHISPQNAADYLKAIQEHGLVYLLGYASSLFSLAQAALEQNLSVPPLKAILSNAEPLYEHQKEVIGRVFGCPVYDTYGLSENVCAASECHHGNFHLWPEVGVAEILDEDDKPLSPGQSGRLVCTGLLNKTMPLIRYEVGDRAFFSGIKSCACGRTMPVLGGIEGRNDDILLLRDGRRIGRLDPVFKSDFPIREAQIIQDDFDRFRVNYVPSVGFSAKDLEALKQRLCDRLGQVQIEFELLEKIPRTANGKFRAVISNLRKN